MDIRISRCIARDGTTFDQNQILDGERRIAYCGTRPGCPINFIVALSYKQQDEVIAAVSEAVGHPNKVSQPSLLVDDEDEYEDEDDE